MNNRATYYQKNTEKLLNRAKEYYEHDQDRLQGQGQKILRII